MLLLQVRHKSTQKVYAMKLLSKFEMVSSLLLFQMIFMNYEFISSDLSHSLFLSALRLNFVVEWLTLLLHIWEVLGSNVETGYPD
jgi:hypothetical protein